MRPYKAGLDIQKDMRFSVDASLCMEKHKGMHYEHKHQIQKSVSPWAWKGVMKRRHSRTLDPLLMCWYVCMATEEYILLFFTCLK